MTDRWNQDAGRMRQRVIIEYLTDGAPDSRGHPTRTWATAVNDVSAFMDTLAGYKLEKARQQVPTASHTFEIGFRVLDENNHRLAMFSFQTTLTAPMTVVSPAIVVASGYTMPVGVVILIGTEQMQVTNVNGNTLAVARGYNGTTIATHAIGARVRKKRIFNIGHQADVEEMHVKLMLTCTELKGALAGN